MKSVPGISEEPWWLLWGTVHFWISRCSYNKVLFKVTTNFPLSLRIASDSGSLLKDINWALQKKCKSTDIARQKNRNKKGFEKWFQPHCFRVYESSELLLYWGKLLQKLLQAVSSKIVFPDLFVGLQLWLTSARSKWALNRYFGLSSSIWTQSRCNVFWSISINFNVNIYEACIKDFFLYLLLWPSNSEKNWWWFYRKVKTW